MWRRVAILLLISSLGPWSCAEDLPEPQTPLEAALAHPDRDRSDDARRKPAQVLALAGIEPGMVVADLMAGAGWYTEVLARGLGPDGTVYTQNNSISESRYGDKLRERVANAGFENVELIEAELEALGLPAGQLDAVFLVQFYHDTVWMGVDRVRMNQEIFASLAPGGVYVVIDHRAEVGSGTRDVETLHRIDPDTVRDEISRAGFELAHDSDLLSNSEDDLSENVFGWRVRGETDRFLFVFRKPVSGEGAGELD